MACITSYELHHQFPRLAEESGFTFNTHRPRVHIDWNKIRLIDIDSLIRDRKFVLIEQHLNDILDCVFESEFDVRILDEGVMKMFRLAQLAVEYQQFCRHYLDRSVFVLREEITSLAHELDTAKKQLQDKEEELRKLRKRSRHSHKAPLPYGNDNIAAMILKTLSNKGDVFPSTSSVEAFQYNKCNYCEKVFMNQLYLQSHIARRHAEATELPQKERNETESNNENVKLSAELMELKAKLKEMEVFIANVNKVNSSPTNKDNPSQSSITNMSPKKDEALQNKVMKDAEVSTNNEEYLLNKFEEWKKHESEKYSKEIVALRNQIAETIKTIKEQQVAPKDSTNIEQLHNTIIQQGAEITALKQELNNTKLSKENQNSDKNKETEAQILFWTKRAETQAKQYESLLQKLNEVTNDAKESRDLAESERKRATELQSLLQRSLNKKATTAQTSTDDLIPDGSYDKEHNQVSNITSEKSSNHIKNKQMTDRNTLEQLHKKAQELLNVASISSSSTESSSPIPKKNIKPMSKKENTTKDILISNHQDKNKLRNKVQKLKFHKNDKSKRIINTKTVNGNYEEKRTQIKPTKEQPRISSGSPMHVIRAKIAEEVNNRLVSLGVDPHKSRLPDSVYQKKIQELQRLHEIKAKKNPMYEKVKNSIMASLDSNTEINKINYKSDEYVSPSKVAKSFRNFSSIISNAKSKALSLVKLNEHSNKDKRSLTNGDVGKKSRTVIRTPPESARESPLKKTKNDKQDIAHTKVQIENNKHNKKKITKKIETHKEDTETEESIESDENSLVRPSSEIKSIDNLIKSPARRPASADRNTKPTSKKYNIHNGDLFTRTQSAIDLTESKVEILNPIKLDGRNDNSSDDIESLTDSPSPIKKPEVNNEQKITKGVLKQASSMSSLNKKKVLFDMDAIQMKSVSASPSQSITEKSDNENGTEQFELGLVNLESEEWDISSIENEPLKIDTKIQVNTKASPKIAELKQVIESQLARRNDITSTAIVGGVDILSGPAAKPSSVGGSNTSLGSSILDESDGIRVVNQRAFVKPKKVTEKEDSEIDISEFSMDGIGRNKIKNDF